MRLALAVLILLASACRPERPLVVVLDRSTHDGEGLELPSVVVVRFDPSRTKLAGVLKQVGQDLPERVILISDGDLPVEGLEPAVRALAKDGATVGAICLGETMKFNAAILSDFARWGRGRFRFTSRRASVGKLLAHEARRRGAP